MQSFITKNLNLSTNRNLFLGKIEKKIEKKSSNFEFSEHTESAEAKVFNDDDIH